MKHLIPVLALVLFSLVWRASAAEKSGAPTAGGAKNGPVLEVAALMQNVGQHKGVVRIEGVVRKIFPKEQKLGLIDATEFKKCGMISACCDNQILPVQWGGPMPEVKSLVRFEGEIRKVGDKLEFVARSLEKVPLK